MWFKKKHNQALQMIVSYQKYESKERNLVQRLIAYEGPVKFLLSSNVEKAEKQEKKEKQEK